MLNKSVRVSLLDYMFVNGGVIAPDRVAIFQSFTKDGDFSATWEYRVTNVKMCGNGFSGVKDDDSEMTVLPEWAYIDMPISILNERNS